jgi:hypothetical protein
MLQAFYQVITPVHSVFRYLQQIKLVANKFFAMSLIIFTPLYFMGSIGRINTHILIFDNCQQSMWCLIVSTDEPLLAKSVFIITPLTIAGIVEISWYGSRACRL